MDSAELDRLIVDLHVLSISTPPDIQNCSGILRAVADHCKNDRKRQAVNEAHWHTLFEMLVFGRSFLKKENIYDEELNYLADLFRCLRNCCAGCYRDDQLVISSKDLIGASMDLLLPLVNRGPFLNEKAIVPLRCCIQMFGNLVCQSNSSKQIVWKSFIEERLFVTLLECKDVKVEEYTMMILYNCLTPEHQQQMLNTTEGRKLLITLTDVLLRNIFDWGILVIEVIMSNEDFMEKCYTILPLQNRLLVLDIVAEVLGSPQNDQGIPEPMLRYIKQHFIDYVLDIVKTCESYSGDLKSVEITKLLGILCSSSVGNLGSSMKSYRDLLEVSIEILKSVHLLGKKSCNAFSTVPSLKDVNNLSKEDVELHPSFGFKKNLVRLIGNLCSGCRENQDLVRQVDGIPLLLDCCNLDVRNPYIMQWCVLAIRNILENNPDNQAVLASVSVTSAMTNSPLLRELGLEVELENGRAILKTATFKAS